MFFETTLTVERGQSASARGLWPGRVLGEALRSTAAVDPQRSAIVDARTRVDYAELAASVDEIALGLLEIGVRHNDVVSVQLPNWSEFIIAAFAVERIGAVINPIAPIFRRREVAEVFRLARPVVAIVASTFRGFDHAAMLSDLASTTDSLKTVVVVDGLAGQGDVSWAGLRARGAASTLDRGVLDLLTPGADDVYELIFTSGTTGQPKGVMHTHNTLWAANQAMIEAQRYTSSDVFHMASTFAHQTGLLFGVRMFVQARASAVFQDSGKVQKFKLRAIAAQHQPDIVASQISSSLTGST